MNQPSPAPTGVFFRRRSNLPRGTIAIVGAFLLIGITIGTLTASNVISPATIKDDSFIVFRLASSLSSSEENHTDSSNTAKNVTSSLPNNVTLTSSVIEKILSSVPSFTRCVDIKEGLAPFPLTRHITWKTTSLPRLAAQVNSGWNQLPEITTKIHTNDDCLALADKFTEQRLNEKVNRTECQYLSPETSHRCSKNYIYNFSQIFRDYQLNVMRADVCRALSVYFYGGIYMDLDVDFRGGFKDRLMASKWRNVDLLLGWENENDRQVSNFLFGAAPHHPCIRQLLEEMLRAGQDGVPFQRSNHAVHYSTGPNVVTLAMSRCRVRNDYFSLNPRMFGKLDFESHTCSLDPAAGAFEAVTSEEQEDLSLGQKVSPLWWKPKVVLPQGDLFGGVVHHHFGSNAWKHGDYSKESWVEHRKNLMNKLVRGERADAIGRLPGSPTLRRNEDDDEKFPTLVPKIRHVVQLLPSNNQPPSTWKKVRSNKGHEVMISPTTAENIDLWQPVTTHFVTQIHTSNDCKQFGNKYSHQVNWKAIMSEDLCGLLAVLHFGGFYVGSRVRPKPGAGPILNWTAIPWNSSDLIVVELNNRNDTRETVRTDFIAARRHHDCLRAGVHQLQFLDPEGNSLIKQSTVLGKKFSSGLFGCNLKPDFFPWNEWELFFVNGYSLHQLRYEWSWKKAGGIPFEIHYERKNGGLLSPKSTVLESALTEYLMDSLT